ncbi:hypothetical protein WJX74_001851 [Apatococcus lobatus]|uniref:F-box domain-containing protein n=1 Tax=Apatococcus lobatus TaxID=904363 RepID=A0AAW1Q332_9CHLO
MGKLQGQQKKRGRKENDKRQRKRQKKQNKLQLPLRARPDQPATLEDLPLELLARIIRKMPFPQRLTAAGVSKRWKEASTEARSRKLVKPGMTIMEVIENARPGDTILLPPGYYPELLLIEKPLRIIGQPEPATDERPARPVVLQSNRPVLALCNARCYFENVTMRTGAISADRSICCFGPDCPAILMKNCELGGASGLLVPNSLGPKTKLILRNCHLHSVGSPMPAIAMEAGSLTAHGCTISDCEVGIEILEGVRADLRHNNISFTGCGILMDGIGRISDNVLWGNACHMQGAALHDPSKDGTQPPATPAGPQAANGSAAGPSALPAHLLSAATPGMPPTPATPQDLSIGEAVHRRKRAHPPNADHAPPPVYLSNNHIRTRERGTAPPRTPAQKRIRTRIRDLTRSIYGRHDDNYEDWEMIEGSDLDSEGDESDDSEDFSSADDDSSSGSNDSSIGSDNDWDTDDDGGPPPDPDGQAMFEFMGGPVADGGPIGDDSSDDDFSASSFYSTSDESSDESSIDESSSSDDNEDNGADQVNEPIQPAANANG